jgi:hypothetical protein
VVRRVLYYSEKRDIAPRPRIIQLIVISLQKNARIVMADAVSLMSTSLQLDQQPSLTDARR